MRSARLRSRGFTLIATLLLMLLLSGIAIGLLILGFARPAPATA